MTNQNPLDSEEVKRATEAGNAILEFGSRVIEGDCDHGHSHEVFLALHEYIGAEVKARLDLAIEVEGLKERILALEESAAIR